MSRIFKVSKTRQRKLVAINLDRVNDYAVTQELRKQYEAERVREKLNVLASRFRHGLA